MYEVTVTADLAYADADGQPLLADLYRPATEQAPAQLHDALAWCSPRPSSPPPCALPDRPTKE